MWGRFYPAQFPSDNIAAASYRNKLKTMSTSRLENNSFIIVICNNEREKPNRIFRDQTGELFNTDKLSGRPPTDNSPFSCFHQSDKHSLRTQALRLYDAFRCNKPCESSMKQKPNHFKSKHSYERFRYEKPRVTHEFL